MKSLVLVRETHRTPRGSQGTRRNAVSDRKTRDAYARSLFDESPPPLPPSTYYPICSPKPGGEVRAYVLSNRPICCMTHFHNRQTSLCSRKKNCHRCMQGLRRCWKAYLAGQDFRSGKLIIVEVTPSAWSNCTPLQDSAVDLRGAIITLRRKGNANNSPVTAHVEREAWRDNKAPLRKPFDLVHALLTCWRESCSEHPNAIDRFMDDETPVIVGGEEEVP